METTYRTVGNSTYLSEEQRVQFYHKMKMVVVLVECSWQEKKGNRQITMTVHGGGVVLDKRGYILTAAHVIDPRATLITYRRVDEDEFWEGQAVRIDRGVDVAILKLSDRHKEEVEEKPWDFATLADSGSIDIGMETFSICHPSDLYFSIVVGQVAFECKEPMSKCASSGGRLSPSSQTPTCRFVGDTTTGERDLQDLDKDLPLIQINNLHGSTGSSGAPVFNSNGRVIGLYSLIMKNFDFAIPCDFLGDLYQRVISEDSELPPPKRKRDKLKRKRNKKHGQLG